MPADKAAPMTPEQVLEGVEALAPHEQLELAAGLLQKGRPRLALAIARRVVTDLEILHARGKL